MDFVTPFINFLLTDDEISKNKLFVNAVKASANNIGVVTSAIDRNQSQHFVDGSWRHTLTFTINNYKPISQQQLMTASISGNLNIENLIDPQKIIDFIEQSNENGNFPYFGTDYEVEEMRSVNLTPPTPTVTDTDNPLAKFALPIEIVIYQYAFGGEDNG